MVSPLPPQEEDINWERLKTGRQEEHSGLRENLYRPNEELHNLYSLKTLFNIIKEDKIRGACCTQGRDKKCRLLYPMVRYITLFKRAGHWSVS
jgi:hypothetical protein